MVSTVLMEDPDESSEESDVTAKCMFPTFTRRRRCPEGQRRVRGVCQTVIR
jgi:hypothetical protein